MGEYTYYVTPEQYEEAQRNGISKRVVDMRIRSCGWPTEKAIRVPVRAKTSRAKWLKVAEANGIPRTVFYNRVNGRGWSNEKAATTPVMSNREIHKLAVAAIKAKARITEQHIEIAALNGIKIETVRDRVYKLKWSVERAINEPVYTTEESLTKAREAYKRYYGHYWHELGNVERLSK